MDGGRPFALAFHAHPGIEVVSRDRGGLYADGTARRAPGAKQVVDRWHLLEISDKHCFPNEHPALQTIVRWTDTSLSRAAVGRWLPQRTPALQKN